MRALVLSGGGAKGAYQIGVLRKLMSEGERDYEILCGVSVGALNCAAIAMTPMGQPRVAFGWLERLWSEFDTKKVWVKRAFGDMLSTFLSPSIYDASPLTTRVRRELDGATIAASGRKLRVGAVALNDGEYRSASEDDPDIVEWVLASSAYPVFFEAIAIDGKLWTDGGVRNVTPLGEAIRLGATQIDVVMCSNPDAISSWSTRCRKSYEVALRAIDLMGDEIIRTDLQVAGLKNDLSALNEKYRRVTIRVIQPSQLLPVDALDFTRASLLKMMRLGYEDAGKILV